MPGFLGGSSGTSGTGGEIRFPKEFIDPVTKLRISQPENLIDTDFEYGLQPTKWETVELINNTPSFFSKSGDTTIPGIVSISTNSGTREITVTTATDHGLAVGIPINVTGTKSVTADGSYIINSIPNTLTFTYLCKDEQQGNNAIEDLYTSIITGEFFQGSQIRIADAEGIITDGEAISTLTVKTDSTHGFGLNTPFYFLNLNSTISQEFEASNTAAKSFDSSNSATAQTFDGSNTLSTFNIDWSNSATVGGTTSTISAVSTINETITVTHGAETFAGQLLGTPLYYNLSVPASTGYFFDNPRGVVFLKTITALNTPAGQSTFQVSATPDGTTIDIVSSMSGTFQLANQARTFAGNNENLATQQSITLINDTALGIDASNSGLVALTGLALTNIEGVVSSYSGGNITAAAVDGTSELDFYAGRMLFYTTTGSAATGLTNNTTYFIDQSFSGGGTNRIFTIKPLPSGSVITSISGGTGTQKFRAINVSVDKDIFHIKDNGFAVKDMLKYSYPAGGRFAVANSGTDEKDYYFVETRYDVHNFTLTATLGLTLLSATGAVNNSGTIVTDADNGLTYRMLRFNSNGTLSIGGTGDIQYLVVGGGGGGGMDMGGGGGAGGFRTGTVTLGNGVSLACTVGAGGRGGPQPGTFSQNFGHQYQQRADAGGASTLSGSGFTTITANGGGYGASSYYDYSPDYGNPGGGASGGGASGYSNGGYRSGAGGNQGNRGGNGGPQYYAGGGGGSAGQGTDSTNRPDGGSGTRSTILGTAYWFAAGGGGNSYSRGDGGYGGIGGGGGGSGLSTGGSGGGSAVNSGGGAGSGQQTPGGNAGANTGSGGGGGQHYNSNNKGGDGGTGIIVVRWRE
jgi:hypothetical protein